MRLIPSAQPVHSELSYCLSHPESVPTQGLSGYIIKCILKGTLISVWKESFDSPLTHHDINSYAIF